MVPAGVGEVTDPHGVHSKRDGSACTLDTFVVSCHSSCEISIDVGLIDGVGPMATYRVGTGLIVSMCLLQYDEELTYHWSESSWCSTLVPDTPHLRGSLHPLSVRLIDIRSGDERRTYRT